MLQANKIITFVIAATLLSMCSDNSTPTLPVEHKDSTTGKLVSADSNLTVKPGIFISDTIISEIRKSTPLAAEHYNLCIDTLVNLNAENFYVVYSISSGVCLTTYVMTFKDKKLKDFDRLEQACDGDYSHPSYKWSELRNSPPHTFKKVTFIQTPIDKNVLNAKGEFKDGFSMDNIETQTDSTTILISISNDATIKCDTLKHNH